MEGIPHETLSKFEKLKKTLGDMGKVIVAFSGGADSSFLLKVAHDVLGDDVLAVIAESETYPEREKKEAIKLAKKLDVRHMLIHTRELDNPDFAGNPPQRCYYCKKELFSKLKEISANEGIDYVLDGANFEDIEDFRPGAEAAKELGVRSPLKETRLIKAEIRELSRGMSLPTWDKPSMACLSSRFPYYMEIDKESLMQVSQAEDYLRELGFSQLRVRHHGQIARIELEPEEIPKMLNNEIRTRVIKNLKKFGYTYVALDLCGYRTGSMNEPLVERVKRKTNKAK